jgi:predicted dehydrogenase
LKKINAAVVGLGFIGMVHVEALRRLHHVNVAAVCDSSGVVENKALQLGIEKYYSDYTELLANNEIDSVHICTPNHLHFNMVREALNAGKHVICEKPLTTKADEAKELVELAQKKGLIHAVNFNVRYYPLMRQLKQMIEKDELGEIYAVQGSYLQDWLFFDTDYNWRLEPEIAGKSRAVADIGSHWMDLMEYVTGLKIAEVMADFATFHKVRKKPLKPLETYSGKVLKAEDYKDVPIVNEDYATVMIKFNNDARGVMTVSQMVAGRKNRIYFEIHGARKSVSWDAEKPDDLWIGKRDGNNEILMRDPALFHPGSRMLIDYPGGHVEGFPDTFKQCFKEIYSYIAQTSKTESYPFPTFRDGLREITLCDTIMDSNEKRKWMKV